MNKKFNQFQIASKRMLNKNNSRASEELQHM